jgi:hypothetical protein
MTLSLTCKACGTVLTAADEDELAALGQRHAEEHGHGRDRPLSRAHILARIRRHNPPPPSPSAPPAPAS